MNENWNRVQELIETLENEDRQYSVIKNTDGNYVLESEQRRVLVTDNVQWIINTLEELVSLIY